MNAMTETRAPYGPEWAEIPNFASAEEINPPDIDPMGLLDRGRVAVDMGLGSVYARIMYELVGSHRNYHDAAALAMLATATQHRWLPLEHAKNARLRPNLYAVLLGESSLDHKSTAGSKVVQNIPWDYMTNARRLPALFTEEGMYKELVDTPFGLVWIDEISKLFASRQRKYTEFLNTFLTEIYDGDMPGKRLSNQSHKARDVAVTILGATTYSEFARTTTDSDWGSGWLVRWLIAVPDDQYDVAAETRGRTDADEAALAEVRRRLIDLNTRMPAAMSLSQNGHARWRAWRKELLLSAVNQKERHRRVDAIIERYATYALKFAMLLSAGRGDGETVTLSHVEGGVRLAENFMTNNLALYRYLRANRVTGSLLHKVLTLLNARKEGLTRREIGQLANISDTGIREEVIELLLGYGAVAEEANGRTTRIFATQKRLPVMRLA